MAGVNKLTFKSMKTTVTSSWKLRLQYNSRLKHECIAIYKKAVKDHLSHDQILNLRSERLFEAAEYKRLPDFMRYQLNSYFDALLDVLWTHVSWVHWYNGVFVGSNLPYGAGFDQSKVESAHCYTGTEDCYTERKFADVIAM
jgi:hypothetical protein